MNQNNGYSYESIEQYYSINFEKINNLQQSNEENHNDNSFSIYLDYYIDYYYQSYYLEPPRNYILNLEHLKQNKEDIFSKGKILTFSNNTFSFDAIVKDFETFIDKKRKYFYYCYIQPIKKEYRKTTHLCGHYKVIERSGDLTYIRMKNALKEFYDNNGCCSQNLHSLIIGNNINNQIQNLNHLFYFSENYKKHIKNFGNLS